MNSVLLRFAAVAFAGLGLVAGNAAAAQPFTDPAGDSGTAADITSVSVSNDANRQITFQVSFANALASTDSVAILLDTDQNAATGNQNAAGAEYLLVASVSDNSFGLAHWDGSTWQDASAPTASVNGGSGSTTLTFSINASDLGSTAGFNFWVDSIDGTGGVGHEDQAPDSATWNYPLSSQVQVQVHVVAFEVLSTPRAGHHFQAALIAQRSDTGGFVGPEGTLTCTASVGGRRLTAVPLQLTVNVGGESVVVQACDWSLPRWTRGKIVRGTVTVTYQGAKASRSFSARVH